MRGACKAREAWGRAPEVAVRDAGVRGAGVLRWHMRLQPLHQPRHVRQRRPHQLGAILLRPPPDLQESQLKILLPSCHSRGLSQVLYQVAAWQLPADVTRPFYVPCVCCKARSAAGGVRAWRLQ